MTLSMCHHDAKGFWDALAAVTALLAAGFWFAAARQPVPSDGPQPFGSPATKDHYAERNRKIKLGARFNRIAAAFLVW